RGVVVVVNQGTAVVGLNPDPRAIRVRDVVVIVNHHPIVRTALVKIKRRGRNRADAFYGDVVFWNTFAVGTTGSNDERHYQECNSIPIMFGKPIDSFHCTAILD